VNIPWTSILLRVIYHDTGVEHGRSEWSCSDLAKENLSWETVISTWDFLATVPMGFEPDVSDCRTSGWI